MTTNNLGMFEWTFKGTKEGHREYLAKWLIETTDPDDGPGSILFASGLPTLGSSWSYGNDNDPWAFCTPDWRVHHVNDREPTYYWIVETPFTTNVTSRRCNTTSIEDPLDEPFDIGGSWVTKTIKNGFDRNGAPMMSSSFEPMEGEATEKDDSKPTVKISGNFSTIDLAGILSLRQYLNDSTLWGLGARQVKFSDFSWSRKFYGVCNYYYKIDYGFQVDENTFDRTVLDMGTRELATGGTSSNPAHFVPIRDATDEKVIKAILKNGRRWDGTGSPGTRTFEKYNDGNLLLLGIPSSLV